MKGLAQFMFPNPCQTLVQPKKHQQWAVRSQSCGIFSSQHWPRRDRYSRSVEWDKCEFETCAWWRYIASEPHDDWAAISSTKVLKAQNARSQDFHFGGFYTKCWVHNLQKVLWDKDDNKIRPCQKWETFEQVYSILRWGVATKKICILMNPSNKKVTGGGLQSQNASLIFSPGRSNKPEPVNHDGSWKERPKQDVLERIRCLPCGW